MTRYWFHPKRYGYGATPFTWEGWLATALCCAVIVGSMLALQHFVGRSGFLAWMIWAAVVAVALFGFVRSARGRTDGEWRWRWGEDRGA